MKQLVRFLSLAVMAIGTAVAQPAGWPDRPIRIIIPQSPGGQGDRFLRTMGKELAERLGRPVVVENRSGGNAFIGVKACTTAAPDGYTFCALYTDAVATNPYMFKNIPYDPTTELRPVTPLFFATLVLTVNPSLGVKTMDELVDASKKRPGTMSYATPSQALAFTMETIKRQSGADMNYIPYRGGADAAIAVLSGSPGIGFLSLSNVLPQIRDGQLVALAVDGEQRSSVLPNTPTMKQAGYGIERPRTWFGLFSPPGVPDAIVDKMHSATRAVIDDAKFAQEHIVSDGLESARGTPKEFAQFVKGEQARARRLVEASGFVPQ